MADTKRRSIVIPSLDTNLVAKYSWSVIYYVAGWVLQRTSLALLVSEMERAKYLVFANGCKITKLQAKATKLPYELVEIREKKNLFYPNELFFRFICFIESIYIKNLTIGMMMAYLDGDLLQAIDEKIKASEVVKANFAGLFASGNAVKDSDRDLILCYVLGRYVKMRGC